MNALFQKNMAIASLVVLIGFTSCQENKLVIPDQPVVTSSELANSARLSALPKVYKLTRHGDATLTYYNDGRLKRVTSGADARGNTKYRREYSYDDADHRIDAYSYIDNQPVFYDAYWIDDATGRCHRSTQIGYLMIEENVAYYKQHELTTMWYYTYTTKGQLKTCQHLYWDSSNRTEYTYNADDDLIKTITYDRVGKQDGVAVHELTLTYDQNQSSRSTVLADKNPLNTSWAHLPVPHSQNEGQPVPEVYLPIFGKPSKHLVASVTQTKLPTNQHVSSSFFTYTLNTDGYVTERKEVDARKSLLLETKPFGYLVTDLNK
ncbi:DUF4595 domain-containing protein [Spirosoma arboris]|nr:DUF4595 domain-containing protein [Spirosoma arboris]